MPETMTPPVPSPPPLADDVPYEVVDGKVVEKPPMGALEAWVATTLAAYIFHSGGSNRSGRVLTEAMFNLDHVRNLRRRPDLAFVSYDRWPRRSPLPPGESWDVIPDLAVEVVSPSNTAFEVLTKLNEYFLAGVRLVWVVYPEQQTVYAYRSATDVRVLGPADDLDGGDVIPGFRLPLRALFEDEPGGDAPAAGA